MRIQHNIMAMNAYRNYSNNTAALSKNLEKLSSGYKINRAGDDAAGLAISEKMRAQITGLEAAQKNVKDGISLVNTAEGALQEVQDMLNRMVYLAQESANGTFDNEVDRKALQSEVDQLRSEINRIADSANFNGIKLLDGSLAAKGGSAATSVGKIEGVNVIDIDPTKGTYSTKNAVTAATAAAAGDKISLTVSLTDGDGNATQEINVELTMADAAKKLFKDADGNEYTITDQASTVNALVEALKKNETIKNNFDVANDTNKLKFTAKNGGADAMQVRAVNIVDTKAGASTTQANGIDAAPGEDAYQTIDITSLKIYEGADATPTADGTNKLDRATFTVNGKKFAVVDRTKLTDDMKAELKAAGVEHFLDVTSNDWDDATADDLLDAAHKIGLETGLTAELGVTTEGADNTFATDDTATGATAGVSIALKAGSAKTGSGGLMLQIGDSSDDYNQLRVNVSDMHTKAMGIANIDISTQSGAQAAVDVIKNAINYVSDVRGTLGAISNRLDHTANNLSVMRENIQDAESSIRDTDVAEEMMAYTKNNILVQSAQAMLAQANQVPQGVLQLLQ